MRRAAALLSVALIVVLAAGSARSAADPSFVYVASGSSQLFGFGIGPTGNLTPLPGPPLPAGFYPSALAIDSAGRLAYAVTRFPNQIVGYAVNPATGALTPLSGFPYYSGGFFAIAAAVDGLGRFLYVGNNGGDVEGHRIDAAGQLSPVAGQPFPVTGIIGTGCFAADPAGAFLYVATGGFAGTVSVFRIDAGTGALSHVPGSPFAAEPGPNVPAVDPSGRFLYVANEQTENISAYAVDPTSGALTPVPGSPFRSSPRPMTLTVDPTGQFVFAGNAFSLLSAFRIDAATGALTPVPGSPFPGPNQPNSLYVDPAGGFLYVADPGSPLPGMGGPPRVWAFHIAQSTGALSKIGEYEAGPQPWALAGYGARANRPPDCTHAHPSTASVWPPNHRLVSVGVLDVKDPEGAPVSIRIDGIRQDEPVDSTGDGEFAPDGFGVGASAAQVRADRTGGGDGRVYHVAFKASDTQGGSCSGVVKVSVPHDKETAAVDGGALYDSTTP